MTQKRPTPRFRLALALVPLMALSACVGEDGEFFGSRNADADGPARQVAVDMGNNIITISEEEAKEWEAAAKPVYDTWLADMESKGKDGQALLDEVRMLIDKYTE